MNKAKQWAAAVSAVSIVSSVIMTLIPESKHKKLYSFFLSVVLIYIIIQPLSGINGIDFQINDYLRDNYQVSENLDKYAKSSVLNSAEKAIEDILEEYAENNSITCKAKCECLIENDQIIVTLILIEGDLSDENISAIKSYATDLGINENVLTFAG